jgi:hypothetical protein
MHARMSHSSGWPKRVAACFPGDESQFSTVRYEIGYEIMYSVGDVHPVRSLEEIWTSLDSGHNCYPRFQTQRRTSSKGRLSKNLFPESICPFITGLLCVRNFEKGGQSCIRACDVWMFSPMQQGIARGCLRLARLIRLG